MRKLLLKAALIPILFTLTGLYMPRRRGLGTNPPGRSGVRSNVADTRTRAEKVRALQARVEAGDVVRNDDGTYREVATGHYVGSDGTAQDGSGAEDAVIQQYKDRGYETHDKGPYAFTPTDITGRWESTFTDRNGDRHVKGEEFTVDAGTRRQYDGFVNLGGDGEPDDWHGIETKSGDGSRTPNQRAIDEWLNSDPSHTIDVDLPDGSTITVNGTVDHLNQ